MKKIVLSYLVLSVYSLCAQSSAIVFKTDTLIYYGIDFSKCRLIGDFGNGGGAEMKNKMFPQWNEIFLKEQGKYDLKKTFRKDYVFYELTPVSIQNVRTDDNQIRTFKSEYSLDPGLVPKMVAQYETGEFKSGLGLVFIVDNYDKNKEQALVYVTFFDIATKKIYFSEELKGVPAGAGLRNYWSRAIFEILKSIEQVQYVNWQSKYGK